MQDLAAFCVGMWPLALIDWRRRGGTAAEVARWFAVVRGYVEVLHGMLGGFVWAL